MSFSERALSYSSIHVRYADGSKASDVQVVLDFMGAFGGKTKPVTTDRFGVAVVPHRDGGHALVYVNGRRVGSVRAPCEADLIV